MDSVAVRLAGLDFASRSSFARTRTAEGGCRYVDVSPDSSLATG